MHGRKGLSRKDGDAVAALEKPAVLTWVAMDSHASFLIRFSVTEGVCEGKSSRSGMQDRLRGTEPMRAGHDDSSPEEK